MTHKKDTIKKKVLPNGLTLYYEFDDNVEGVFIGTVIHAGSKHEKKPGVAHFLEHLILSNPIESYHGSLKLNLVARMGGNYYLDINSRFLFKNEAKLKLTEKEVDLILYLKNSKTEKSSQDLQKDIWRHVAEVETHTVETHIYRLRKKISDKFEDNNFIIYNKNGYKIENWKKEIILQKAYYLKGLGKKKLNQKKVKEVLKEKKINLL